MAREGAALAFTYPDRAARRTGARMAGAVGSESLPMDVSSDAEIDGMYAALAGSWDKVDVIIHSVAFAPREQLAGVISNR